MRKTENNFFFRPVRFNYIVNEKSVGPKLNINLNTYSSNSMVAMRWLFGLNSYLYQVSDSGGSYRLMSNNLKLYYKTWFQFYGKNFIFFNESAPLFLLSNFSKIGLFARLYNLKFSPSLSFVENTRVKNSFTFDKTNYNF